MSIIPPQLTAKDSLLQGFISAVTIILVFFLFSRTPQDADLWWHLRAGEIMWEQKTILLSDEFSFTYIHQPWVNASWISELLLYGLYRTGGYLALAAFVSLIGSITFYIIQRSLSGNSLVNGFIIVLAAITAAPIWGPRPQILSFLLIAILQYILQTCNSRRIWLLVVLFTFWANVHGGWIWGFLLLLAHIVGNITKYYFESSPEQKKAIFFKIRDLIGLSVLCAGAVGINPNGIAIWRLPFNQINVSMQIQEWLSPDFHRLEFHPMLWIIFLLIISAYMSIKSINWPQLFTVIGFAYLTFVAQRNIALFAISAVPLLSDSMNPALRALLGKTPGFLQTNVSPRIGKAINISILLCLCAISIGRIFLLTRPSRVDQHYPAPAIEWIRKNEPPGNLFNSYNWGGYLIWNLPEYPVFIDGRADMYGDEIISQWLDVANGAENAVKILDQWDINILLIEPSWPITRIIKEAGWKIGYQDGMSIIFLRH